MTSDLCKCGHQRDEHRGVEMECWHKIGLAPGGDIIWQGCPCNHFVRADSQEKNN